MHDYDSAQVPVLFDGMIQGKMRKMVLTAARNGYYFTLDRVTGERLVSSKYGLLTNWANRFSANGEPMRDPSKDPTVPGSLVSPNSSGTVNWEPPAFSPSTGLLYVPENNTYSIFYLTDIDPRGSMGLGGREEAHIGSGGDYLTAIDYKTGKAKWRHRYEGAQGGGGGILATAGGLVFAGDGSGSLVAHDAATGVPLWNTRIGEVTNAPQTYLLDGHQYVICATGDRLWSFLLY
jgi:alcohol dehydrogenase (cytochrome c)